jgi:hypothetical protein
MSGALLIEVAKALRPDGCVMADGEGDEAGQRVSVDGIPVKLRIASGYSERNHKGKVRAVVPEWPTYPGSYACGVLPRDLYGKARPEGDPPSWEVFISPDKGADRIAKEIRRRLVEPVKPWYEATKAEAQRRAEWAQITKRTRERIVGYVPGAHLNPHSTEGVWVPGMHTVTVNGENVRMEAITVDIEKALRIMAIVREGQP